MASESDLEQERVALAVDHDFFRVLLAHLPTVAVDGDWLMAAGGVRTMAVDGRRIYYVPEYVRSLSAGQRLFGLAHEMVHPAFQHMWRRGGRVKALWDIACDHATNHTVMSFNRTYAAQLVPPPGILMDSRYADMTAEQIYDDLSRDPDGARPRGAHADGHSEEPLGPGEPGGQPDDSDEARAWWKARLREAVMSARMHGTLPEGMDRIVDGLLDPRLPWTQILEGLVSEALHDDYDMSVRDRRFDDTDVWIPDLRREGARVAVLVDASASIRKSKLARSATEAASILWARGVCAMRLLSFDADVHLDVDLLPGDKMPFNFPGGGGTRFGPAFERISEDVAAGRIAAIVVITDMAGEWPAFDPCVPTIWAACGSDLRQPPFGAVVEIPEDAA